MRSNPIDEYIYKYMNVFSGTITAVGNEETGVTYPFGDYGAPTETPLITSGILRAFDAETGKECGNSM